MSESRLQSAVTVVPVISAGLYLLGLSYHQGYLGGFGIDDSLFPLATDRALLFGFFAFVITGLKPMSYVLVAAAALFIATLLATVLSSTDRVKRLQMKFLSWFRSTSLNTEPSSTLTKFVDDSGTAYSYMAGSFLVVLMLVLISLLAAESGQKQAEREIESFSKQTSAWVMVHSPLIPNPTRAKQVTCSPSHCAFWLGTESLILRHDSIERILTHNPSVNTDAAR